MPNRPVAVIKLGSSSLLDGDGLLDLVYFEHIAGVLSAIAEAGMRPVLVSSGAVAAARGLIEGEGPPRGLADRQALAAIGQADLVHRWQQALRARGLIAAQVLLTAGDFEDRERFLNLTATFRTLFARDAVPIINENDTVSIEELSVGDNDRLSSLVASQLGARRLLLLTDIDGVYDRDPRHHDDARLLAEIPVIADEHLEAAGEAGGFGRGGMRSKLRAAALASAAGVEVHIAHGRKVDIAACAIEGCVVGTRVPAAEGARQPPVRRWLNMTRQPDGIITIDAGAVRAICEHGRSLLPVGISAVDGDFTRGASVAIVDEAGQPIAYGLTSLSATDLRAIQGARMDHAARVLGRALPAAAVHRDNMLVQD
ncbi:MAG: glutamate 5-kinase [Planctomycetota bacterium]|jgi:glutamate 5-kinase